MQRRLTDFYSPSCADGLPYTGGLTLLNMSSSLNLSSSPRSRKRKSNKASQLQQTIIDAGQKKIGLQHCAKCEMVYNIDDKKDVEQHEAFHNRFAYTKFYRVTVSQLETWKGNLYWEYVSEPVDGLLFRLSAASTATLRKRVEDIIRLAVNEELGYCSDLSAWDVEGKRQALIFIAHSLSTGEPPFVGALTLIDPVTTATLMPERKHFHGQFICINRIWTHTQLRRRGLATFLLNSVCRLGVRPGQPALARSRVAFSDPTDAGIRLATKFVGQKSASTTDERRYIVHVSSLPSRSPFSRSSADVSESAVKRIKVEDVKGEKVKADIIKETASSSHLNCFGLEIEESDEDEDDKENIVRDK